MKTSNFLDVVDDLRSTNSMNYRRDTLVEFIRENDAETVYVALNLFRGDVLDDPERNLGMGKKTVRKSIAKTYDETYKQIREVEKELGNLTMVPTQLTKPTTLKTVREHDIFEVLDIVDTLSETSSETKAIDTLASKLSGMENPEVLVYACVSHKNDYPMGVSWKTIREACSIVFPVTTDEFERLYGIHGSSSALTRLFMTGSMADVRSRVLPYDRVRPMLAVDKEIPEADGEWIADTKYDGGRLLIHAMDGEIRAYTRNRREISDNLPELDEVNWPVDDFIVDTEAIGVDPETGDIVPFQEFMTRFQREKNIEKASEDVSIQFKVFDILYWRGEDVTTLEYWDRRNIINSFFSDKQSTTYRNVEEGYQKAVERGYEGIIAKRHDHTYDFHRQDTWRKVKPVKEPIDLMVAGAVEGTGRVSGTLGALKLVTSDGTRIGRVGTGFSDAERERLWNLHEAGGLVGSIVEIKYEGVQQNGDKYGLRFPRYERFRPEGEADSIEDIQ